jgi:chromosome segregation ATPase
MNNARRKQIAEIVDRLSEITVLRDEIKEAIESIRDEEQEYFDYMPESLQGSERGIAAEEAIGNLEYAISDLEDLDMDAIEQYLQDAQG